MPITIKELLAADTISQAVDKINFNFDQLLLNGGGPVGPSGPVGPPGPIGGRGLRGTQWYEDPNPSPGTNPNTLIFVDVLEGDSYLQSDGTVWEYNGTVWVATVINLTGPQGVPGTGNGFEFFNRGGGAIVGRRGVYPLIIPTFADGASTSNEGVSSVLIGGVPSNAIAGAFSFTPSYQLTLDMSTSIESDIVSLFIHQKNASSSSILFHGGDGLGENFEQNNIGQLSNISLQADDQLVISVPKAATGPSSLSDLVGYRVNTLERAQEYNSGKFIQFITGTNNTFTGLGSENSDFIIDIDESNPSNPSKFEVGLRPPTYNSIMQLGGGINPSSIITTAPTKTGTFYLETGDSYLYTSATSTIGAQGQINLRSRNSSINLNSATSTNITNIGSGGINITQSTSASGDIDIVNSTGGGGLFMRTLNGSTLRIGGLVPSEQDGTINIYNNSNPINITNGLANITIGVITGDLIAGAQNGNVNISTVTAGDITVDSIDEIRSTAVNDIDSTSTGGQHKFTATGKARPANLSTGSLGFEVNAHVSPNRSLGAFQVTETTPAFASGLYQTNPTGTSYPRYQQQWVKMGDVVHVTAIIDFGVSGGGAAQNPLNVFIPIPVLNASSRIVPGLTSNSNFAVDGQNLFGHGTWYINGQVGSNPGDNAIVPIEVKPAPVSGSLYENRFYITYPGYASGLSIPGGGNNYTPLGAGFVVWESTVRCTYTYTLTTA